MAKRKGWGDLNLDEMVEVGKYVSRKIEEELRFVERQMKVLDSIIDAVIEELGVVTFDVLKDTLSKMGFDVEMVEDPNDEGFGYGYGMTRRSDLTTPPNNARGELN